MMGNFLAMTRTWMEDCTHRHEKCLDDNKTSSVLPSFILDVGVDTEASTIRFVETKRSDARNGQYVYLSAKWGPQSHTTCSLRRDNITTYTESISLEELPPTVADAVTIIRRLGLQYLWVSKFCIIQDEAWSVQEEILRIPEYLKNATLVLVVASGVEHYAGLLHTRPPPLLRMDLVQIPSEGSRANQDTYLGGIDVKTPQNGSESSMRPGRSCLLLRNPIETASEALGERALTRAWMIQEVLLPKRVLIVGKDQLYWHCHTMLLSEGSKLVLSPFLQLVPRIKTPSLQRSFFPWYSLMNSYSQSHTDYPNGKFYAMRNIALRFAPDSLFVDGLWAEDFNNGILWYAKRPGTCNDQGSLAPFERWPSWSWLSLGVRHVLYNFVWGAQHDILPESHALSVLAVHADPFPWDDRGGRTPSSPTTYAELRATLLPPTAFSSKGGCICFFDRLERELQWIEGSRQVVFMLVCVWNPTPLRGSKGTFGLGLILDVALELGGSHWYPEPALEWMENAYARIGLFLMPEWEEKLSKGVRRDLIMV